MKLIILALALIFLGLPVAAFAAAFRSGTNPQLVEEFPDDLYVIGQTLFLNGPVAGDLFVAGRTITVLKEVRNDLNAVGSTITVDAAVSDDVRVAGATVTLRAATGDDVLGSAAQFTLERLATVGGDLLVGGGEVTIEGNVAGRTKITASKVVLNGTFEGDVSIEADHLTIGSRAKIGEISYFGENEASVSPGAQIGELIYTERTKGRDLKAVAVSTLYKILVGILTGFVVIALFRRFIFEAAQGLRANTALTALGGFFGLIAGPLLGLVAFSTVIGVLLGALLAAAYGILLVLGALLGSLWIGQLILRPSQRLQEQLGSYALGVAVVSIAGLIPVVGPLAGFVVVLVGFGGILKAVARSMRSDTQ